MSLHGCQCDTLCPRVTSGGNFNVPDADAGVSEMQALTSTRCLYLWDVDTGRSFTPRIPSPEMRAWEGHWNESLQTRARRTAIITTVYQVLPAWFPVKLQLQ